jgi:hypothetical protein
MQATGKRIGKVVVNVKIITSCWIARRIAFSQDGFQSPSRDGFYPTAVRGMWLEVNDLNHSAMDAPNL